MRVKLYILVSVLLLMHNVEAFSQTAANQSPHGVHVFPNVGMFVFYADVTDGVLPTCSGDNRWSIKTDKPGAKTMISMVIAAKTANKKITVVGDGSCNPDGFGYQVNYLYLN